ncbi:MAG: hypothetical protein I3274_02810 [Candidatus Moeniiplasma glomeromycotorum]|nr:hypothetical protein [Candidatus Moeniiplasma glomeromycotorum]MCE8167536.1 hypothetical protein [Candidatus Moeniiplasma glomeromycotorum]
MTNSTENTVSAEQIKQKLGETTEQLETKVGELFSTYSPHYSNLEPWQRGLLLIALTLFLIFALYYLTSTNQSKKEAFREKLAQQKEKEQEEKFLRQMAFFKKLKE